MFPEPGSASETTYRRACKVMPNGTSRKSLFDMRSYAREGEGSRLRDVDGRWILDGSNNFMVLIHGHRHGPTMDAVAGQIGRGLSFGLPTEGEVWLAEHLAGRVASVERVVFCSSGTEAVMHAVKAARAIARRPKIAKCEGLYHGTYDYAEVSNASPVKPGAQGFPRAHVAGGYAMPHVVEDTVVIPFNDAEVAERIIRERASEIAGILIDPVPSRVGYTAAEPDFVRALRRIADEFGIVLVFDEVASFRVAHGGAQSLYDVRPDLTAFGKIIGGGMPVGAVGGSERAMRVFDPADKQGVSFTGTFNAHPVTMAAGLATLEHYGPDEVARLNGRGESLRALVRAGIASRGLPAHVRGHGSFVSFFFSPRIGGGYHAVAHRPGEMALVNAFWSEAMDRNLLLDVSARMNISTAYSDADVEEAAAILLDSLETAFHLAPPARQDA